MRIVTTRIEDFIENLKAAEVYRKMVYFERSKHPVGAGNSRTATSFDIVYQASAVLNLPDEGQALLVCGVNCGVDRLTGDGGSDGTNQMTWIHNLLKGHCDQAELRLIPGVLDQ